MTADSTDVRAASPTSCKPLARRPPITKSRASTTSSGVRITISAAAEPASDPPEASGLSSRRPPRRRVATDCSSHPLARNCWSRTCLTPTRPSSALPAAATARPLIPRARPVPFRQVLSGDRSGATPGRFASAPILLEADRSPRPATGPTLGAHDAPLGNRVRQGVGGKRPECRTASRR